MLFDEIFFEKDYLEALCFTLSVIKNFKVYNGQS